MSICSHCDKEEAALGGIYCDECSNILQKKSNEYTFDPQFSAWRNNAPINPEIFPDSELVEPHRAEYDDSDYEEMEDYGRDHPQESKSTARDVDLKIPYECRECIEDPENPCYPCSTIRGYLTDQDGFDRVLKLNRGNTSTWSRGPSGLDPEKFDWFGNRHIHISEVDMRVKHLETPYTTDVTLESIDVLTADKSQRGLVAIMEFLSLQHPPSSDGRGRLRAVQAIGHYGDPRAIGLLASELDRCLADRNPLRNQSNFHRYVGAVLDSLGRIGKGEEEACDALLSAFDKFELHSDTIVWALGKVGMEKALPAVVSRSDVDRRIRMEALLSIGGKQALPTLVNEGIFRPITVPFQSVSIQMIGLHADETAIRPLMKLYSIFRSGILDEWWMGNHTSSSGIFHHKGETVGKILTALSNIGGEGAISPIVKILENGGDWVDWHPAAKHLSSSIGELEKRESSRVVEKLLALLGHDVVDVVYFAFEVLKGMGGETGHKVRIALLKEDYTQWKKHPAGKPVHARASSCGTEGWNYGEKLFADTPRGRSFRYSSVFDDPFKRGYRSVNGSFICADYLSFSDRGPGDGYGGKSRILGEIVEQSIIKLQGDSLEELAAAIEELKEDFPEAKVVNPVKEFRTYADEDPYGGFGL